MKACCFKLCFDHSTDIIMQETPFLIFFHSVARGKLPTISNHTANHNGQDQSTGYFCFIKLQTCLLLGFKHYKTLSIFILLAVAMGKLCFLTCTQKLNLYFLTEITVLFCQLTAVSCSDEVKIRVEDVPCVGGCPLKEFISAQSTELRTGEIKTS